MYVLLAKALASGQGYRWLHLPGTPAAIHFPPGYPAVLALLWTLFPAFPGNVIVFKLANALFAGVAAFAVARLVRTRFEMSEMSAQGIAIAALLASPVLTLIARVMSEPLFLALLLPALIFAEGIVESSRTRTRDLVALGLLCGLATLVRTHGIALVAAVALMLLLRRRCAR
jgi:Gpi18-like mannosyltransferase